MTTGQMARIGMLEKAKFMTTALASSTCFTYSNARTIDYFIHQAVLAPYIVDTWTVDDKHI